jgi:hypothetical protein
MTWLGGIRKFAAGLACAALLAGCSKPATEAASAAPPKTDFTIAWTIYAGWMPWPYAQQAGIVDKWAKKYGLKINVVQVNDYVESLNQFTAGKVDGVTSTTMDALTVPAAGGKDTSVIIIGDYSNGISVMVPASTAPGVTSPCSANSRRMNSATIWDRLGMPRSAIIASSWRTSSAGRLTLKRASWASVSMPVR